MGYKAAVQVLKQADDLKAKISKNKDFLNNSEAWADQQKLQTIYHQVLVLDLEYALDKKVELDLWNVGFKNHISSLQDLARDKKNPKRSDFQALLTWALESASGFYLTLLQELCNTFDVDLPFRRRGNVYGQTNIIQEQIIIPQTSSCLYICQYCLVHLGDIARYRNQRKQAESFYKQAILVSPTSGHPYNQLALLEASKGDKLSTVFYYIRGIAVKFPFPASTTNLLNTLNSCIDKDCSSEKIQAKMTVNEFIHLFLCTHGYFQTATELQLAQQSVKTLNSIMTPLVATQSFTKDQLIKITVINLYALKNLWKRDEELTDSEKKVRELILELVAGSLSAFLMPVHTLNVDESLMSYYALPAIKFLLYFIKNEPEVLKENVFKERLQIWPSLCKLVNNNTKYLKGLNYNKYIKYPLQEDKNLQGFLPLAKSMKDLDFKFEVDEQKVANLLRMKRFLDFTLWLVDYDISGTKFVIKKESNGITQFDPCCTQPDPTNELLEEMRSFNITEIALESKKSSEKKAGILKPQGSLEKSREEREVKLNVENEIYPKLNIESSKSKRSKQNVALQSIYKKMEENKQVKFNVDEPEKEKPIKFDPQKPPPQPPQKPPQSQAFPHPLRTQSFNQNHPAFPLPPPPPQQDYLANLRNVPNLSEMKNDQMVPGYQHKAPSFPQGPFGYGELQANPPFGQSQFNSWQRSDVAPGGYPLPPFKNQQENWWQSIPPPPLQTTQSYSRQDSGNYPMNYPPNFGNSFMPNTMNVPKPPQGHYDMFNSLPWGVQRGYDFDSSQSISMRQAMLKEATSSSDGVGVPSKPLNNALNQQQTPQTQPQGYSLFNTNSWTPNLANLRNNKVPENAPLNLPQHSLFGGHGPKSLAQLLEHQQNQMSKNDL